MPLNKGGGQRGQGGTLADGSANDATASPILTGRVPQDYAVVLAEGLGRDLTPVELEDISGDLTQYRVVAVGDNTILAEEFDGTTSGGTVQIARSPDQRRSFYDGVTFQLVTRGKTKNLKYTYVSAVERDVTDVDTGQVIQQEIRPRYKGGSIIYAYTPSNGTGVTGVVLQDANANGRRFTDVLIGGQQLLVTGESWDYWECKSFIDDEAGTTTIYVAKPPKLRRKGIGFADIGGAFEGIRYDYSENGGTIERLATIVENDCQQTEILIPRMAFSLDRIYAMSVDSTGILDPEGNEITLVDINSDARFGSRIK